MTEDSNRNHQTEEAIRLARRRELQNAEIRRRRTEAGWKPENSIHPKILNQCHRCQFHCGDEHLNCAVNPTFLNDSEQETCGHYEEEIIIEDPGKWHRPHLGEAPDPIPLPNHIGEPPHPTPLRMMVSEDGLRVRAHLQALGIYMEDYSCSDNCPESQSEDY